MYIKLKGFFKPETIENASIHVLETYKYRTLRIGDVDVSINPTDNLFMATISLDVDVSVYEHLVGKVSVRPLWLRKRFV
ncbi:hypothetical protein J2W55_004933 [Mucilaginibacter pocheonensis]|uniref:Uncharacterized protein n=1 Tax=Mucilaginibacter pocheonensis TaxID=398050 RepID=A0ABU1TIM0_9SPHI|nr:hypothetical protein [Mucilaginibacter pocheonensis]